MPMWTSIAGWVTPVPMRSVSAWIVGPPRFEMAAA